MEQSTNKKNFWRKHLDKIGVGGSFFAALCCLGFPALLSLLSAIGLGFLINDAILLPLLAVFLLLTVAGLAMGLRHHHKSWALALGVFSAVALAIFILPVYNIYFASLSIVGLIAASILNVIFQQRFEKGQAQKST